MAGVGSQYEGTRYTWSAQKRAAIMESLDARACVLQKRKIITFGEGGGRAQEKENKACCLSRTGHRAQEPGYNLPSCCGTWCRVWPWRNDSRCFLRSRKTVLKSAPCTRARSVSVDQSCITYETARSPSRRSRHATGDSTMI